MFRGLLLRRSLLKVGVVTLVLLLASLAAVLSRSSDRALAATQGPVAEYSFDEGEEAGATVEDLSEEGNDATLEGAKRTTHGRYGGALEFSGEETCATVPTSGSLQLDEEFTLEAWVRPSGTPTADPIFFKESEGTYSYAMSVGFGNEGQPEGAADGEQVIDPHTIEPDVWTHIAFTYDGASLRLYVDGELVESEHVGELQLASEGPLYIGCDPPAWGDHFRGRIDEARIYERVLGAGEIDADMETAIATPKTTPVAEYAFDGLEEGAQAVEDHSGHEHTATIHGATPTPFGRYGGAMEFKGNASEYLSVPDSSELDFEEEFTLEAWVRPSTVENFYAPVITKLAGGGGHTNSFSYGLYAGDWEHHPFGEVENPLGTGTNVTSPEAITAKTWTHLAFTFDGGMMRLYVDGELVDEYAADPPVTTEGELEIGAETEHGDHFEGRIDEVRIYGRALDAAEVDADMETPIQTPKAGPIAAYSFDEGEIGTEGGTVQDVSEHEHTATIEDGRWAKGRYGGGNKCVSVPDSPELRLSEEFTLEAWVRPDWGIYEDPVVVRQAGSKLAFGLGLGDKKENSPEGFIGQGKTAKVAYGGEVAGNGWSHVATTYDGAKIRTYLEGELVATEAAPTAPSTGEGALKIGCDGPDGQFTGRIDEVRVYGRALSGAEIGTDMEAPLQTPKQTPVASYSFDEKNEETATDTSGDGHTATVEGAKWTEHGRYGGAMEFTASEEDVLKIPASEELDFDQEFTLEAWVRPSGEDNKHAPLIDKQEGSGHGYFLYEGGSVSDRPYGAANEEQEFIHAENPLPADTWSHVALTFSGNRTYLYVNGELVDNGAAEPTVTSEGELEIGGSSDTADYFDGRIDEVRIYNRALNGTEVVGDLEAPIQTPKQGPIAAWSFDEGLEAGPTVEDVTGDEHEGTIEGATRTEHGRYGGALKFDGTTSCVSVPASEELRLGEEFTLEGWVKPEGSPQKDPLIFEESSGHAAWGLGAGLLHSGRPEGTIGTAGGGRANVSSGGELEAGVWSHLALTFDGSMERLYVDGVLVATEAVGAPESGGEGTVDIGCDPLDGAHFKGRIDEVSILDRAINSREAADLKPPTLSESFDPIVLSLSEISRPVLLVPDAIDPALPDGSPGSGVAAYWYRYSLGAGGFSKWTEGESNYLELSDGVPGEEVTVELYVVDRAGNISEKFTGSTTILAESGDIPVSPSEGFEDEGSGPGEPFEFGATAESSPSHGLLHADSEGGARLKEKCKGIANDPHESNHANERPNPERRVNAVLTVNCFGDLPVEEGRLVNFLIFKGEIVAMSKWVFFEGLEASKKAPANEPCRMEKGLYWAKGIVYARFSPAAIPIGEATGNPEVLSKKSKKVENPCL
jgi:hypothetical protein